ncbi:hypothetical protein ACNO7T_17135 [Vibrio campbellii]
MINFQNNVLGATGVNSHIASKKIAKNVQKHHSSLEQKLSDFRSELKASIKAIRLDRGDTAKILNDIKNINNQIDTTLTVVERKSKKNSKNNDTLQNTAHTLQKLKDEGEKLYEAGKKAHVISRLNSQIEDKKNTVAKYDAQLQLHGVADSRSSSSDIEVTLNKLNDTRDKEISKVRNQIDKIKGKLMLTEGTRKVNDPGPERYSNTYMDISKFRAGLEEEGIPTKIIDYSIKGHDKGDIDLRSMRSRHSEKTYSYGEVSMDSNIFKNPLQAAIRYTDLHGSTKADINALEQTTKLSSEINKLTTDVQLRSQQLEKQLIN